MLPFVLQTKDRISIRRKQGKISSHCKQDLTEQKNVTYNWDRFVFGPQFAMDNTPLPLWVKFGLN
jgi:hypothetical protein